MNDRLISILILTLSKRAEVFNKIALLLRMQCLEFPEEKIQILVDDSDIDSIGEKRNRLLEKSSGMYVCFIDDDDIVSDDYIKILIEAAKSDCDCASLKGAYSVNGVFDGIFEHSLKYNKWETVAGEIKYLRYPNHLNMIRADIAKKFKFPEVNHGEDHDWSKQVHESGLLKTEHYIPTTLYYYNKISN